VEATPGPRGNSRRVDSRLSAPTSVFQKLKRQKITLDQVYESDRRSDHTDSVKNCYGGSRRNYNRVASIPGRIKDYSSRFAAQLYPVLAPSVMGPSGRHFRSCRSVPEMPHGVPKRASRRHWKYKEGRRGGRRKMTSALAWPLGIG